MLLQRLKSRQAEQVAAETRDLVQDRDITTLAITGLSAAGGVVVAQTVADAVLDAAGLNVDPTNLKEYGASILTKFVVASGFALVAANVGGLGLVASGFMAVGALASAGVDLVESVVTNNLFSGDGILSGSAPMGGMSRAAQTAATGSNGTSMSREQTAQFRSRQSADGSTKRPDSRGEQFR